MDIDILIAAVHRLGSIITVLVLYFAIFLFDQWRSVRYQKRIDKEDSFTLGIRLENIEKEENAQKLLELYADKFSSDLLRNRISDFCGLIHLAWGLLAFIVQTGVVITVCWYMITKTTDAAVLAWSILGMLILVCLITWSLSFVCLILTGRFPGEAKSKRKWINEQYRNNLVST
jgi:ABC-type multidrug transport system fused ATPase/permease subunit